MGRKYPKWMVPAGKHWAGLADPDAQASAEARIRVLPGERGEIGNLRRAAGFPHPELSYNH